MTNTTNTSANIEAEKLSLRDYFAGQALVGLIPTYQPASADGPVNGHTVVEQAYEFADAMLEQRKKGGSE